MNYLKSIMSNQNYLCRTKEKKLFTGTHDYFPAFWIGEDKNYKDKLDTYPIYIIDIDVEEPIETDGNFRSYMSTLLIQALKLEPNNKILHKAKGDLHQFSLKCINKGPYTISHMNSNSDCESDSKSDSKSDSESDYESDCESDSESDCESDSESDCESDSESDNNFNTRNALKAASRYSIRL